VHPRFFEIADLIRVPPSWPRWTSAGRLRLARRCEHRPIARVAAEARRCAAVPVRVGEPVPTRRRGRPPLPIGAWQYVARQLPTIEEH
jgi:hypothetical protein